MRGSLAESSEVESDCRVDGQILRQTKKPILLRSGSISYHASIE